MIAPDLVARESAAWIWYPDDATVVETAEWLLIRWPAHFGLPPSLQTFTPHSDHASALDAALDQARAWGSDACDVWVRLDAPYGFEALLRTRGGEACETVDVFALDLGAGVPDLDPPGEVELRLRVDPETVRAGAEVTREAFGQGGVPSDARIAQLGEEYAADHRAGRGCALVAYLEGAPVGSGGVTIAGTTARLWSGGVVPAARGRGVYRAILDARLRYAVDHGATMALVKGRVETSGPILRRAGFTAYGQERSYRLPLQ